MKIKFFFYGEITLKGVERRACVVAWTQKDACEFIEKAGLRKVTPREIRTYWSIVDKPGVGMIDNGLGVYCAKDTNYGRTYEKIWSPENPEGKD